MKGELLVGWNIKKWQLNKTGNGEVVNMYRKQYRRKYYTTSILTVWISNFMNNK